MGLEPRAAARYAHAETTEPHRRLIGDGLDCAPNPRTRIDFDDVTQHVVKSAFAEETEQGSLQKGVSNEVVSYEVVSNPGRTTSARCDGGGKDDSNGVKNYAEDSQEVEKINTEGHNARRTRDNRPTRRQAGRQANQDNIRYM